MAKKEQLSHDASAAAYGIGTLYGGGGGGKKKPPPQGESGTLPPLMKNYKGPEKGISFSVDLE